MSNTPRTEAARSMFEWLPSLLTLNSQQSRREAISVIREMILAIESEAASLGSQHGFREGAQQAALDRDEAAATPQVQADPPAEGLRESLERLAEWAAMVSVRYGQMRTEPPYSSTAELRQMVEQARAVLTATPTAKPEPDDDDAECGCGAIGVAGHTNAEHYGNAKPEAGAGLDDPRAVRIETARHRRYDGQWTGIESYVVCRCGAVILDALWDGHDETECPALPVPSAYAEAASPRSDAGSER